MAVLGSTVGSSTAWPVGCPVFSAMAGSVFGVIVCALFILLLKKVFVYCPELQKRDFKVLTVTKPGEGSLSLE